MNNKRKTNTRFNKVITHIIFSIMLFLSLIIGAEGFFTTFGKFDGILDAIILFAILMLTYYLAVVLQVIFHEIGHFIFGKLTGYKLISLHVGKFALVSDYGKYMIKKDISNTDWGLCKMRIPETNEYRIPFILFYLGGSLANLIFGVLFLFLYHLKPAIMYVSFLFVMLFTMGLALALINGIPLFVKGKANDGMKLFFLISSKESRRAFYVSSYIGNFMDSKHKLQDAPRDLFDLPADMDLRNPYLCALGFLRFSYLCTKNEEEEAMEAVKLGKLLINNAAELSEEQRNIILCVVLSDEMTGLCRKEEVGKYYTDRFKKYAMESSNPAFMLQLYAYELLINRNIVQADKYYKEYEKLIIDSNKEINDMSVQLLEEYLVIVKKKDLEFKQQILMEAEA